MNNLDDNGLDADPSSTWILLQIGDSGEHNFCGFELCFWHIGGEKRQVS